MNVALTIADDRLLHGEGRDPLPRPDRRAARAARRAALGLPRGRRRRHAVGRRPPPSRRPNGEADRRRSTEAAAAVVAAEAATVETAQPEPTADAPSDGPSRSPRSGSRRTLRRHPGRRRRVALGRARRDRRHHRSQRRRQDDAVRPHLRASRRPTAAACVLGGVDVITTTRPHRRALARARPLVPGRPAVPGAHRRGDDRRRARAVGRRARPAVSAALHLPAAVRHRGEGPAAGRRAHRAARPRAPSARSSCASCPPGRAGSSTSPASSPTARPSCCSTSRRAASRSARPRRSARCCCASATSSAPALLVIEHDMPLVTVGRRPAGRHGPGRGHRRRRPADDVLHDPTWSSPPTSAPTDEVIARSGSSCPDPAEPTDGGSAMQPSSDRPTDDRSAPAPALRAARSSRIVVVVAVVAVVAGRRAAATTRKTRRRSTTATGERRRRARSPSTRPRRPGTSTTTRSRRPATPRPGKVAMPFYFAPRVLRQRRRTTAGPPSEGVTADTIKVGRVRRARRTTRSSTTSPPPIKNDDTNAQVKDDVPGLRRHVQRATTRPTAARWRSSSSTASGGAQRRGGGPGRRGEGADEDLGAFAVWGGPVLTSAFADELAARKVICIGCTRRWPPELVRSERAPYAVSPSAANADAGAASTSSSTSSKQLAGGKADARRRPGDADQGPEVRLRSTSRSNDESAKIAATASSRPAGRQGRRPRRERSPYTLDPARLQEQATSAIAKLKSAGVTDRDLRGDPVAPATFTQEATAPGLLPGVGPRARRRWSTPTAFARTYDQQQWAHAFGDQPLAGPHHARADAVVRSSTSGSTARSRRRDEHRRRCCIPQPSLFFAGVQAAGPEPDRRRRSATGCSHCHAAGAGDQPGDHHLRRPRASGPTTTTTASTT